MPDSRDIRRRMSPGKSAAPIAALLTALILYMPSAARAAQSCGGDGGTTFICGVSNAEDMTKIPGTDWLVASSIAAPRDASHDPQDSFLTFINMRTQAVAKVDAGTVEVRRDPQFSDCPGALKPGTFSGHGLNIGGKPQRLYAVNHGSREAVEIFDIVSGTQAGPPLLRWVGCVLAPKNAQMNAVVALPDGGIAVTKYHDERDPPSRWIFDMFAGLPTGYIVEWHVDKGWLVVPDSSVSGPNGLAISPDGRTYYIAAWGDRRIVRLSRGASPTHRESVDVGVQADNMQWDSDGKLIVAGQIIAGREKATVDCIASTATICTTPFRVFLIDPESLAVKVVIPERESSVFGFGTVAVDISHPRAKATPKPKQAPLIRVATGSF